MGSKIRVLPDDVINKIAAGEVIANTASVVKELVENSLDSGASEIIVEIKSGGRSLIRISDNGCGMNRDDALLCLERHGTSKIRDIDDLNDLSTMGFRGEAIPSIASISKFTLITTPKPEETEEAQQTGTMVLVEGGKILNCNSAVRSPGTTIEVKALFYNVPVRKKFQRSPAYDSQEIVKMVSTLALANPHVRFQLIDDQKELLSVPIHLLPDTSFSQGINERIRELLGKDFLSNTYPVLVEGNGYSLRGVIGHPSFTRQNKTGQYLFVNNRAVQSPLINFAIREGFGTALPSQRHPVYVLYLDMPGGLIDVNVHPQKREIRLREETCLKSWLIQAVSQTLQARRDKAPESTFPQVGHNIEEETVEKPSYMSKERYAISPSFSSNLPSSFFIEEMTQEKKVSVDPSTAQQNEPPSFFIDLSPTLPTVLATLPGYFFVERAEGLCLVDQRRSHHRILFEKLTQSETSSCAETEQQLLLIPLPIEMTKPEATLLRDSLLLIQKMGITIREFGETSFLVDAFPSYLTSKEVESLIHEMLQDIHEFHSSKQMQKEREKQMITLSARAAISSEKKLSMDEAYTLMKQLMETKFPYQCPRGTPTMVMIKRDELSKLFQF